jgi:hypothetical protein
MPDEPSHAFTLTIPRCPSKRLVQYLLPRKFTVPLGKNQKWPIKVQAFFGRSGKFAAGKEPV